MSINTTDQDIPLQEPNSESIAQIPLNNSVEEPDPPKNTDHPLIQEPEEEFSEKRINLPTQQSQNDKLASLLELQIPPHSKNISLSPDEVTIRSQQHVKLINDNEEQELLNPYDCPVQLRTSINNVTPKSEILAINQARMSTPTMNQSFKKGATSRNVTPTIPEQPIILPFQRDDKKNKESVEPDKRGVNLPSIKDQVSKSTKQSLKPTIPKNKIPKTQILSQQYSSTRNRLSHVTKRNISPGIAQEPDSSQIVMMTEPSEPKAFFGSKTPILPRSKILSKSPIPDQNKNAKLRQSKVESILFQNPALENLYNVYNKHKFKRTHASKPQTSQKSQNNSNNNHNNAIPPPPPLIKYTQQNHQQITPIQRPKGKLAKKQIVDSQEIPTPPPPFLQGNQQNNVMLEVKRHYSNPNNIARKKPLLSNNFNFQQQPIGNSEKPKGFLQKQVAGEQKHKKNELILHQRTSSHQSEQNIQKIDPPKVKPLPIAIRISKPQDENEQPPKLLSPRKLQPLDRRRSSQPKTKLIKHKLSPRSPRQQHAVLKASKAQNKTSATTTTTVEDSANFDQVPKQSDTMVHLRNQARYEHEIQKVSKLYEQNRSAYEDLLSIKQQMIDFDYATLLSSRGKADN